MSRTALLVGLILAGCSGAPAGDEDTAAGVDGGGEPGEGEPDAGDPSSAGPWLSEVPLAATHNSYSGNIGGDRGTISEQLELGVRVLELDIHDNDFPTNGYRIGHDGPGHEVDHGGSNPDSDRLSDWLDVIAAFSADNPEHAPIIVTLDAKDDLTDNEDRARGNMDQLGVLLEETFGASLLRADAIDGEWPAAEALRGRVAVVLSGDHGSRLTYRRADGQNPAVAVNASGQVVVAHDDGSGVLWAWTGVVEGSDVRWLRRTRYDTGTDPAIALTDDGVLVEVHEAPGSGDHTLFYRVGTLGAEGDLAWVHESGLQFPNGDNGVEPSLQFTGSGLSVREVHLSQSSGDPFYWNGAVDVAQGRVVWTRDGDNGSTTDARFDETVSSSGANTVAISTGALGVYGSQTLGVSVNAADRAPIRHAQVFFVDAQPGSSAQLRDDPGISFFTASASDGAARSWAGEQRAGGGLVRLYGFEDPGQESNPAQNYAATDHPFDSWYRDYCLQRGCLDW